MRCEHRPAAFAAFSQSTLFRVVLVSLQMDRPHLCFLSCLSSRLHSSSLNPRTEWERLGAFSHSSGLLHSSASCCTYSFLLHSSSLRSAVETRRCRRDTEAGVTWRPAQPHQSNMCARGRRERLTPPSPCKTELPLLFEHPARGGPWASEPFASGRPRGGEGGLGGIYGVVFLAEHHST